MFFFKKYGFLLTLGLFAGNPATSQNLLDRAVDFECKNLPIADALAELGRQTGIGLAFSPDFFGKNPPAVSLFFKKGNLRSPPGAWRTAAVGC